MLALLPSPRFTLGLAGLAASAGLFPAEARAQLAPASAPLAPATLPARAYESLGQPPLWKPYLAGTLTWNRKEEERLGGVAVAGVYKDLVLPISGAFGLAAEGYFGGISAAGGDKGGLDGGARLLGTSRLLFLSAGVDWNARTEQADFILAFTPYFRRGGLFRSGGNFRVEWIPGRGNSWNFGFQVPLEPHAGHTRPVERDAHPPKAPWPARPRPRLTDEGWAAVRELREAGRWLTLHANFFNDNDDSSFGKAMEGFRADVTAVRDYFDRTDERHPEGRSYALEASHYHDAFDRAFVTAVGAAEGRAVADRAREALLDEVLLPYDRLIGRFKRPDTVKGLAERGRLAFGEALASWAMLDDEARESALAVYDELVASLERGRERIKRHWEGDERKVWLPLELALRPEQHDSQAELDGIVARALGRGFTGGHSIFPTNASRFQLELARSLHAARDYHVLWIHDYAGRVAGKPDPVAHTMSTQGYLKALANRVAEYDETGRLPAFFLFQTQFFYEGSKSRLYLSLLEDPMGHELELGAGHEQLEREVREAQEELRRAVAASERLQAEARQRGQGWLRKAVKVHVSVTFPADLSFRAHRVVPFLPFTPDTITLDHRKLFFYDVTEEDPGSGQALFTGTGVGSEYAGPTWDDRGILASGPALLQLKTEARRLLLSQGFSPSEIPDPLRERPLPGNYDALVEARVASGHAGRALNVHNEVGFDQKDATLVQSILYTLAPKDTLIVVPDSIWASPYWAGQLAGAALRGCHVYVIAPSMDNAPAGGLPILARTREIFARLITVSQIMASEIAEAGGHLRVGLYTRAAPSGDTLGKIREAADGFRRYPFLQDEFPMPPETTSIFDQSADELEAAGYAPRFIAEGTREGRPKMHRKTQLFATRRALRALMPFPQAADSLRSQLAARAKATADPAGLLKEEGPLELERPLLAAIEREPPAGTEDAVYYLTVGSKNQDPRSAILDGETSFVVAGPYALVQYSDFIFLMAATTWVDDVAALTKLLPVEEERARKIGRLIGKVM